MVFFCAQLTPHFAETPAPIGFSLSAINTLGTTKVPTEFRKVWIFLGILASSMSCISFIQKIFSIGLVPMMAAIVNFYRRMLYPLFDVVGFALHIHIPVWYRDLFLLSAIFSGVFYRTRGYFVPTLPKRREIFFLFLNSITLLGCLLPLFYLVNYFLRLRGLIRRAKSETIEEDLAYLKIHPEIKEAAETFRYQHDPFIHIDNPWIYGDKAVDLSDPVVRQKMYSKYWLFHYSFYRHLYSYCVIMMYAVYLGCVFVISIIFYAVNSMLWT
jgi:hypothetical protein